MAPGVAREMGRDAEATAEYLTFAAVAGLLGVSESTVRREVADGKLAVVRVRSKVRIHRDALAEYRRSNEHYEHPQEDGREVKARRPGASLRLAGWDGDDHGVGRRRRRTGS